MRKMERRLFCATWSYTRGSGGCGGRGGATRVDRRRRAEVDVDPVALFASRLEVLPLREAEPLGDRVGRERLDLGVVAVDGVVVELPRVGDPPLRAGELLLQVEEVRVGLEVGVGLGQREHRLQRTAAHVREIGRAPDRTPVT